MNSVSLLLILLWPFLLVHSLHIKQLFAPIGRPFSVSTAEWHAIDAEMLPRWCRFNASARMIYGIPQLDDLGLHLISIHDTHIEVEVLEEDEDICGEDSTTTWLEVIDARILTDLTIQEQFKSVKTLFGFLQKDVDVKLTDVRVFPRSYLGRYRIVKEIIHELDDQDDDDEEVKDSRLDGRIVFVMNISCGELTEQASEIINAIAENGMDFQVVEGELKVDRVPIMTSTTSTQSTTTQQNTRTTRQVHNNRPIVLNPMKTFTCFRGLLCRLPIDENTFMDPEDGSTANLALSVHPIGNHSNFLTIVQRKNLLEGVPLENGTNAFSFRLEARDRQNAANSAPFQVLVKPLPEGKPNHRYSMLFDIPFERFQSQPELLREFVYKLSAVLHPHHQFGVETKTLDEIQIEVLVDNGGGQTMLKWWNASLSWAHCDEARINGTRDRMVHFGTERVKNEFVKRMGAGLHVRKVTLELLGKCLTHHLLDTAQIRVYTTTQKSTDLGQREKMGLWSNQLLIPLILLATILLLITVLTLLCCAHQRRGKKGKRNEFTTKGRPVVFPDEVPHRDESSSADGSLATVTTPMLVEREQPPLDPTKMTMHENPLYRPPPQLQAQLVRKSVPTNELSPPIGSSPSMGRGGAQFAHQSPPPLASTFSSPGAVVLKPIDASPTPLRTNPFLRDHPSQQSVRVHATPVGQRLPPPYVAH